MKKKLLAILLAMCLAVGCLPAPASAAQLTGSKEELEEFLAHYLLTNCNPNFDAENATVDGLNNALYYLLERHPYDDAIYLGENRQLFEPYINPGDTFDWGSDWSTIPRNPDFIPDPLGRFSSETINDYYFKTNEAKFDWVMENIFNLSENDISRMKNEFDERYCYCHEGYVYSIGLRMGGGGASGFVITQIEQKGNLFYVTCDANGAEHCMAYFIVEPKNINGSIYWTLHYATTVVVGDLPDLPAEFNYETPVLPPNALDAGICGERASWVLDKDGLLIISGEDEISKYYFFLQHSIKSGPLLLP